MDEKSNENNRPIKSSFSSKGQTFVTYATDWDMHKGTRKWNELSLEEQNKFLNEQFTLAGETQWDQAIKSDLLKSHASGFHTLIVYVFLSLKDYALIDAEEVTDSEVAYSISESLDEILIGRRIREYVDGKTESATDIPDEDLTFLSNIDEIDAPFDDFYRLKGFLKEHLKNCSSYADSPNSYVDHAQLIIEQMEKKQEEQKSIENAVESTKSKASSKKVSVLSRTEVSQFPLCDHA